MSATVHLFPDPARPAAGLAAIRPPPTLESMLAELRSDGLHARGVGYLCDLALRHLHYLDHQRVPQHRHDAVLRAAACLALARELFDDATAFAGFPQPPLPEAAIAAACRAVWPMPEDEPAHPYRGAIAACRRAANLAETWQFANFHQMLAIATSFTAMALEAEQ